MKFRLLNAAVSQEREEWLAAIQQLPLERQDVYFLPEYLYPYAESEGVEACCVVYTNKDAIFMYPFLKSVIQQDELFPHLEGLQDVQSAYGYGGPVVNAAGEDPVFLDEVWKIFSDWCSGEQVISEFVRFHPLLDNVRWASQAMKIFKDRITVPIMLENYPQAVLDSSYYRVHRQMLRKAERVGFTFHTLSARSELSWFVPLYQNTQDFLQAGDETRFGSDYFRCLIEGFDAKAWLGVVKHSGEIAAAALVLEGTTFLHSHLMGYRRDIKTSGMTNLLYYGIAEEGVKRGKTILHMGGGRTNHENDSLLRFKESLSSERRTFWLGTLCHNHVLYDDLGCQWEKRYGSKPKNYLQFYRLTGLNDS